MENSNIDVNKKHLKMAYLDSPPLWFLFQKPVTGMRKEFISNKLIVVPFTDNLIKFGVMSNHGVYLYLKVFLQSP